MSAMDDDAIEELVAAVGASSDRRAEVRDELCRHLELMSWVDKEYSTHRTWSQSPVETRDELAMLATHLKYSALALRRLRDLNHVFQTTLAALHGVSEPLSLEDVADLLEKYSMVSEDFSRRINVHKGGHRLDRRKENVVMAAYGFLKKFNPSVINQQPGGALDNLSSGIFEYLYGEEAGDLSRYVKNHVKFEREHNSPDAVARRLSSTNDA